jgi:RNA polymerase sigma factor (sigma-70 family)
MSNHGQAARQPDPLETADALATENAFREVYERHYPDVYRYVLRRLSRAGADAPDVTAEVFLVAWRRRDDLPEVPDDLPWLYGVARRVLSRQRRSDMRRERLAAALRFGAGRIALTENHGDEHEEVRAALERLRGKDSEALRLVLWEQLSHREAAQVLGCSENALAIRIHRAKRRMGELLALDQSKPATSGEPSDDS